MEKMKQKVMTKNDARMHRYNINDNQKYDDIVANNKEKWTLVKLSNNKFHVVSTSGKLIKIDEIIEVENNC